MCSEIVQIDSLTSSDIGVTISGNQEPYDFDFDLVDEPLSMSSAHSFSIQLLLYSSLQGLSEDTIVVEFKR